MELQGVTAVNERILRCRRLRAYVLANDRTPLTDGHIDVYADAEKISNANFQHRVNVQVKAREHKAGKNPPKSFAVKANDLRGFLELRGVLYFVVYINKKTLQTRLMYAQLTPFKIEGLLKKIPASGSVSIRLEPFPHDPSEIEKIIRFAANAQSEDPRARIDFNLLRDPVSITLHSDKTLDLSAPLTLTRDRANYSVSYQFADGSRVFVDHELAIFPEDYYGRYTNVRVEAGDFEYANPRLRKLDDSTVEVTLSKGIVMTMSREGSTLKSPGSIRVSMRPTLEERLHDLGFYFTLLENQSLKINGTLHAMLVTPNEETSDLRSHFHFLETIAKLCGRLGVDTRLVDLESLEEYRGKQLLALEGVLLHGETLSLEHQHLGRISQPIGEWNLQFIVLNDPTTSTWRLYGTFDPNMPGHIVSQSTDTHDAPAIVTVYDVIEYMYLPFTLNLHLENLVAAYQKVSGHAGTDDRANETVLNLLRAADDVPRRRVEFLTAATELNSWLQAKYGKQPHYLINGWQIAARTGDLSSLDKESIRTLKHQATREDKEGAREIELACAILLQDDAERDFCLKKLDTRLAKQFKTWPIWRLTETEPRL